jgi:TrmH family RNA methyltransferase|tara:strand:- start:660 stop:1394 length:735 start_codon:yes stop_codon:yes gene_type:complete
MLSKSKLKLIKSLKNKKSRESLNLFIVEGLKGIIEVNNSSYDILFTVVSKKTYNHNKPYLPSENIFILEEDEIEKISNLKKNKIGLSIVKSRSDIFSDTKFNGLVIALDSINDPGNLGTIIRNADWFGIKNIICSKNTVDFYNPKTIQSSMGSFTRVNIFYDDLSKIFDRSPLKIYGTSSEIKDSIDPKTIKEGIILFGSEANGVREDLKKHIHSWISIKGNGKAESLNVSVSSGIILDNIMNN